MKHLKAVFFDMDGVLYDSLPNHCLAWKYAASDYGLDIQPSDIYEHEGRTGDSTINIFTQRQFHRPATSEEIEKIYARKCEYYSRFPESPQMDGATELLEQIRKDGFQIILVTGSGQLSLFDRLKRNFPGIFHWDTMVTSFDVKQGKPNPEPYLKALHKAGVTAKEAIVVENAPLGVHAGVAAGIFTIAVNTGPLPDSKLLNEGANLLFPSLRSLYEHWAEIRSKFA